MTRTAVSCPQPLAPPFPVGAKVRYLGSRNVSIVMPDRSEKPILFHGSVHEIVRIKVGHRGSGRQLVDIDGPMFDDLGDPIIDGTKDGYSVWEYADDRGYKQGRIIWAKDAGEWSMISGTSEGHNGD